VSSGDPVLFLPEKLKQFDAVVMNNTHERHPMLPWNVHEMSDEEQAQARAREPLTRGNIRAILSLDLNKMDDPGKRTDGD
jgi:hypothetical protein